MIMSPGIRKLALTAHVTVSIGWLGAVAAFLALAITGLISTEVQTARAAYISMESITWIVIVPLACAALLTGLIQSLGTEWGLFRHYWVLIKLLITVFATILLLVHTKPVGILAGVARETAVSSANLGKLQIQLIADASAALVALIITTILGIYKPRGITPYGWRKQRERRRVTTSSQFSE
jgi:hypothetical protein